MTLETDLAMAGHQTPPALAVIPEDGGSGPDGVTILYADPKVPTAHVKNCVSENRGELCQFIDQASSIEIDVVTLNLQPSVLQQSFPRQTVLAAIEQDDCDGDGHHGLNLFTLSETPSPTESGTSLVLEVNAPPETPLVAPDGLVTRVPVDCAVVGLYHVIQYRVRAADERSVSYLERRDLGLGESWYPVAANIVGLQLEYDTGVVAQFLNLQPQRVDSPNPAVPNDASTWITSVVATVEVGTLDGEVRDASSISKTYSANVGVRLRSVTDYIRRHPHYLGASDAVRLVDALRDEDETIRRSAAEGLGHFPSSERILAALGGAVNDESVRVRKVAVRSLQAHGPASTPLLIKALEDASVRVDAARALGSFGAEARSALPAFGEFLSNESSAIRRLAVESLKRIGPDAVPYLLEASKNEDKLVRSDAVRALGSLVAETRTAVQALMSVLKGGDPSLLPAATAHLLKVDYDPLPVLVERFRRSDQRLGYFGRAFRKIGPKAVPRLAELLKDENPEVRKRAVLALGWLGPEEDTVLSLLTQAMQDQDDRVATLAIKTLSVLGLPAVPVLSETLGDEDPSRRATAAIALEKLGPDAEAAIPALIETLKDEDPFVRMFASRALANIGSAALPPLVALVQEQDEEVRNAAAMALGELVSSMEEKSRRRRGPPRPRVSSLANTSDRDIRALVDALEDPNTNVRTSAQKALVAIGTKSVPLLMEALAHESDVVRESASYTLRRLGAESKPAVPALVQALEDEVPSVRVNAVAALGAIGRDAESARNAVVNALRDPDPDVRKVAAYSLSRLGPSEAGVNELVETLKDSDPGVRASAASALAARPSMPTGAFGPVVFRKSDLPRPLGSESSEAIRGLVEALEDPDAGVRSQAASSLARIGAPSVTFLVHALRGGGVLTREGAARALSGLGPRARPAIPDLIDALDDESVTVRRYAASGLANQLHDASAVVSALVDATKDPDPSVRAVAVGGLARNHAEVERAVSALITVLEDEDEDVDVRTAAVHALAQKGLDALRALPALTTAAEDAELREPVRYAAIRLGATLVRESDKDKNAKETIDSLKKVAAILASYDAESHQPTKNSLRSIEQAIERLESETNN